MAEALYPELVRRLVRFRGATPEEAADAASMAMMEYLKRPQTYDSARSKLTTYLQNAATGDFLNEREKVDRRRRKLKLVASVEVCEARGNKPVAARTNPDAHRPDWLLEVADATAAMENEFPDPRDREAVQLLLCGERHSEEFAKVLGVEMKSKVDMRREVKRHKDRIWMKLRRLRERCADAP